MEIGAGHEEAGVAVAAALFAKAADHLALRVKTDHLAVAGVGCEHGPARDGNAGEVGLRVQRLALLQRLARAVEGLEVILECDVHAALFGGDDRLRLVGQHDGRAQLAVLSKNLEDLVAADIQQVVFADGEAGGCLQAGGELPGFGKQHLCRIGLLVLADVVGEALVQRLAILGRGRLRRLVAARQPAGDTAGGEQARVQEAAPIDFGWLIHVRLQIQTFRPQFSCGSTRKHSKTDGGDKASLALKRKRPA